MKEIKFKRVDLCSSTDFPLYVWESDLKEGPYMISAKYRITKKSEYDLPKIKTNRWELRQYNHYAVYAYENIIKTASTKKELIEAVNWLEDR